MNRSLRFALMAGIALGVFFYGGLWLTVRRLLMTRHPVLLTLGSFCVRTRDRAGRFSVCHERPLAECGWPALAGFSWGAWPLRSCRQRTVAAMHMTPDQIVLWRWGFVHLNATIVYTWIVMVLLTAGLLAGDAPSRPLRTSRARAGRTRSKSWWKPSAARSARSAREGGDTYLPFVGTLFLFIAVSNLLDIVPGWHAPTGSLSTTAALAICVGVAVPVFGIRSQGLIAYFRHYLRPTVIMLPFHLLSETSRNLALAVRLFGNIMSGSMIAGILLAIAPFFFPVLMQALVCSRA